VQKPGLGASLDQVPHGRSSCIAREYITILHKRSPHPLFMAYRRPSAQAFSQSPESFRVFPDTIEQHHAAMPSHERSFSSSPISEFRHGQDGQHQLVNRPWVRATSRHRARRKKSIKSSTLCHSRRPTYARVRASTAVAVQDCSAPTHADSSNLAH
jgi:hypothetical protein